MSDVEFIANRYVWWSRVDGWVIRRSHRGTTYYRDVFGGWRAVRVPRRFVPVRIRIQAHA